MTKELSFSIALQKLARFGIKREQIYLIDLVPLVEMAWADGRVQKVEVDILFEYLKAHVKTINKHAGCIVLTEEDAIGFIKGMLHTRPNKDLVQEVCELITAVRLKNSDPSVAKETKKAILNGCLDIAASAVTRYPYGLTERFTLEEKEYFHKIQEILSK